MRYQIIEDLSAFGKRTFIKLPKYRIDCSCGYTGTEQIQWLDPYSRVTKRYSKWIYVFCKKMTCIDVSRIFDISKHMVYRLDKDGIKQELDNQESIVGNNFPYYPQAKLCYIRVCVYLKQLFMLELSWQFSEGHGVCDEAISYRMKQITSQRSMIEISTKLYC